MIRSNFLLNLFISGIIVWSITFFPAIPLFKIFGGNIVFFRAIMDSLIAFSVFSGWLFYTRNIDAPDLKIFVQTCITWIFICLILDYLSFIVGLDMHWKKYLMEVASGYILIPIILSGLYLSRNVHKKPYKTKL